MLPPVLEKICEEQRGLVLVTGTTGSGKSTSLASMIDYINTRRIEHVMYTKWLPQQSALKGSCHILHLYLQYQGCSISLWYEHLCLQLFLIEEVLLLFEGFTSISII